jgi:hypothetical protein
MTIAVDFDGTCVAHEFPLIGKEIGAVPVLKKLVESGHQLILYTMRSDIEDPKAPSAEILPQGGDYLTAAVNWFKENDIPLFAIQENPTQKQWTHSPKCYAQLYIDDAALGIPLRLDPNLCSRPFVDWGKVLELLTNMGIIK